MAPAVKTMIKQVAVKPEADIAWQAEDVTVGDVLEALSNIRKKFALAEAQDAELPHPRPCVMTLVGVKVAVSVFAPGLSTVPAGGL